MTPLAIAIAALGAAAAPAQWSQRTPLRQSSASSIVGSWRQVLRAPDGSVSQVFWIFQPNGSFLYTSSQTGGRQAPNGTRVQYWGRYRASPAADGGLFVRIDLTGYAPLQVCMRGVGCRSNNAPPSPQQGYYQVRGNVMRTDGVVAQRENAPPEMLQRLPAVWQLQRPPARPDGGYSGGGAPCVGAGLSRGRDGRCHVNGQGGTCDNQQQQRICAVRIGGRLWRDRNGCLVCS